MCLLHAVQLFAQKEGQQYIDSLLKELPGLADDSNKVRLLNNLSNEYRVINPYEGIRHGEDALALAEQLGFRRGQARANAALGVNYQYKSDYPTALAYFFKALKIYESIHDQRGRASTLQNIGNVYQYQKNYGKVLECHLQSLKISEELGDRRGVASTLSNIGIFYFFQQDYDKALDYDERSLKTHYEIGEKGGIAGTLCNIGNVYLLKKAYARSLYYTFEALRLHEQIGDKYGAAIDLGNIGETYLAIAQDSTGAIKPDSLIPAGRNANLKLAIDYLKRSIDDSRKIAQLDNIIEFSKYLSDAYRMSRDFESALNSYEVYSKMNDSVYSLQNSQTIKQMEYKQALDIKDRDLQIARLAVLKKRNERVFYISGIAVLLVVILFIFRNYKMQKQSNVLLATEKKRSDDLLLNILPSEVASELKEKGSAAARYFDNVTVLFTDFVNFTNAGERMTPQELIDELHTCFMAFDHIIGKYGIEKIKTIGDAYLAVSGLPVSDPMHAERAVQAAMEIRAYMKQRQEQPGNKTFDIRIGIHSGSVVAGIVGVKKFAYDIWGDTVNTAARMEQNSEPGRINISETTYALVKDAIACTYRGEIEAKNKGQLKMYFVD